MLLTANYAAAGRFAWTPGGIALSFGRMLQDGVVHRYLAEHCPERHLQLCSHRAELPQNADLFFWSGGDSLFNRLGRFDGLGAEMETIVLDSLRAYPGWQAELAVIATARQLVHVATGEGVLTPVGHTYWAITAFEPKAVPAMRAARQQHDELSFADINRIHEPVALLSMLALAVIAIVGWRRRPLADVAALATTTTVALLGNAVVCGVFADPHDRYGARMVWLAPLVVALMLCRFYQARTRLRDAVLTAEPVSPG